VYRGMNRVILALIAMLLAVPALAHAKAGIEFDNAIETQQPGDRQNFSAIVMHEPTDPMGGEPTPVVGARPLVTFRNESTGAVMRVRTSATNGDGIASGTVVFPDRGPWTATLSVGGKPFGPPGEGQTFTLAEAPSPPAAPKPAKTETGDGGFPAWLLTLPAAGLAALGIWWLRRPRELGA
jgi:hypothetical protein